MNIIRLVPPMTTSDQEVDRAMSILFDALKAVSRGAAAKQPAHAK